MRGVRVRVRGVGVRVRGVGALWACVVWVCGCGVVCACALCCPPCVLPAGAASATKRPTSCVLVLPKKGESHVEYYGEVLDKVKAVQPVF